VDQDTTRTDELLEAVIESAEECPGECIYIEVE
jgi:ferredoxin